MSEQNDEQTSSASGPPPSTRAIYASFDFVGRHRRRLIEGFVAVIVLIVLASGVYVVKKEEQAVVTRFGKVIKPEVGPGVHYCVPIIDRAHVSPVKRIVRYQVSSNDGGQVNFTILSGDTNLLEIDLALQYRIDNLRNFLFASTAPRTIVTMLAREELVNIIGQNFIDLILTSNRNIIQRHLFDAVTRHLESRDIGVELVALEIVDVRPIAETLDAFRDVNDAIAERMQAVSQANRKREQLVLRARGQADALVMNARANARERVVQARSSAGAFTALLEKYREDPPQVAITRYWQRMRTIFSEASLSAVNPGNQSTIDINMIDGVSGFPPAVAALPEAPAPSEKAVDRPLLASTAVTNIHRIETVEKDSPAMDGQFHRERAERDHLQSARPRSLIFDTPSIFAHSHVPRQGKTVEAESNQKPMVEVIAEEAEADEGDTHGQAGN